MVAATRADVGTKLTSGAIGWPSFIETLLALAAVASLLIPFQRLAADDIGRGGRFADTAISVSGLPERVLPSLCALYGALAEPAVRERLCRRSELRAAGEPPTAIPSFVAEAFAQASRAFRRPLAAAEQRRADLRVQQREGLGDLLALDHAIESIDAELQPYIERYAMGVRDAGPLPLACSFEMAGSALARPSERGAAAQANAVLLLGAALDGHGATAALAASALLPSYRREANCENVTFVDALSAAAALMADARQARIHAAKNEAMRNLLHTAGWQWAAWMVLGLVLVKWSRRRDATLFGVAAALAA
ncbi:MAG TPA: hypothetical protein VFF43_12930, partial [Caldimonas sp.]|nr:hypothetical protein [Caldimonas sp.]